jgi:Uncharacterized conserved protein
MYVEALASIFTIVDGEFQILLMRKKVEPYKGYWVLPSDVIDKENTLEETIEKCIETKIGLKNLEFEQCKVFSELERNPSKRIIAISLVSIIDNRTTNDIEITDSLDWFDVDKLPKLGYDHSEIIDASIELIKNKMKRSTTLKKMFQSDFTLPEIQRMYEQVLGYELDRRNFRKKFIKADLIEETGDKNIGFNGRPAKLYRFKEDIEDKLLF